MQVVIDNRLNSMTMPAGLKSVVVDNDSHRRLLVKELLSNLGFNTIESCAVIADIQKKPAPIHTKNTILVLYAETLTTDIEKELSELLEQRPMPVLLLIDDIEKQTMTRAMDVGVTSFLSLGPQSNRIKHAIHSALANFDNIKHLKTKINQLEERLDNRIVIDKAKGLIMKNRHLDEEAAYSYLRNYAMKNGKKIVDVAEMTIATAELLDKDN